MLKSLRNHWLKYVSEALGLGLFMVSACVFSVLLFHPDLPFAGWNLSLRFVLIGAAMGLTAIAIFKSPFGKLSGAHINPAVTLTFWRLGKINSWDAVFYALFQFTGATLGVLLSRLILGSRLASENINFAVTIPNKMGWLISFFAEFGLSFGMMTMVLFTSNHARLSRFTPYLAGLLIAVFISLEAPVSGMSINPARTFGSAIVAGVWSDWWIYFVAPPLAMLAAAEVFVRAKLDQTSRMHSNFNCNLGESEKPKVLEVTKNEAMFSSISNGLF